MEVDECNISRLRFNLRETIGSIIVIKLQRNSVLVNSSFFFQGQIVRDFCDFFVRVTAVRVRLIKCKLKFGSDEWGSHKRGSTVC